ncbi:ankyrin repeat, PH and SEC7 domain containing protein secG-like [Panicum miliaceum]|uniref:Ankyrin repeat, PH and SEC7 domain containing protein secG-like n=1 Tax=Panicum miliaceum TaxID=4540 RepID=A0A3L6SWG6_PANMI|nr:ankyrin repeat, PH and SEC7 domain containing protein secG-like [Panicum miliaceum]
MAPNPSAVAIQAAVDGNLGLLKKMASKIDLRRVSGPSGWNVLHFAAAKGRLEVCRFLVEESGVDVNCSTADGETPITHAAAAGSVSFLRYLLDHGGDAAMPNAKGRTPLHNAAQNGHNEAVILLLSRGVDVDPMINERGGTPLHLAAGMGHDQAAKALLEHGADGGADVKFRSPYGPSLLMKAVMDGSTDTVKFLLEAGADPNIFDEFRENPIMCAACTGQHDPVEILFPHTKPVASVPDWSVEGIINTTKSMPFKTTEGLMEEHVLADAKARGNEAFAKGDYLAATCLYKVAMHKDPLDATLFANRSLCWLRLGNGEETLLDAKRCKMLRPRWSKARYREGAALKMLKYYKGAANAFVEALKLDPANDEIKTASRQFSCLIDCLFPSTVIFQLSP